MSKSGDFLKRVGSDKALAVVTDAVKKTGSVKAAARLLGVSRSTIKHHLAKNGAKVTRKSVADVVTDAE